MENEFRRLFKLTFKEKLYRWFCRNFPHTDLGHFYMPVWWIWFFGGNWDSGNGGGWYPGLYWMVKRYYQEKWQEAGYTLWNWCCYPPSKGLASERKKCNVKAHGLW